jgi:hypothetical protein
MTGSRSEWLQFKTVRPADEAVVADYVDKANNFWNLLIRAVPPLKRVEALRPLERLPRAYRSSRGGDVVFRPIMPPIIATCLRKATAAAMSEATFFRRFRKIPRSLNRQPWLGVLWDGANMLVAEKNQELAKRLILWIIDVDPSQRRISANDLRKRLAEVLNKEPREVDLPTKIT